MTFSKESISAMSAKERSELLSTLWDVMENDPYVDDLGAESEVEIHLLQERLEENKKDSTSAKSWEETFKALKNRSNVS